MPVLELQDSAIHFEQIGTGFPLLLIAPGGMNSAMDWWGRAAFDPRQTYRDDFQLVVMDQRNAGASTGALDADDPWGSYIRDELALMDHLGHRRFHVMGCCIGCSHALKLIEAAPERVVAAVLEQPIGIVDDNRELFRNMWREWGRHLVERRPELSAEAVEEFGTRMWAGDFVLSVSRDFVGACRTPMLVLPGIDAFHPAPVAHEVAALSASAEVLDPWKDSPELIQRAVEHVREFLRAKTPAG